MGKPGGKLARRRVGRAAADSYVRFDGLLSGKQLDAAQKYLSSATVQRSMGEAILFDENPEASVPHTNEQRESSRGDERTTRIAWLERNSDDPDEPPLPGWLDRRLRLAARATHQELGEKLCPVGQDKANRWRPRYEPVQYAEYGVGAHYQNWHTDAELDSNDPEDARAITIVMLLRRANKGGKFQVRVNGKASEVALQPGDAIGFPAKRLEHRVTRCQAGLRQSIVCWVKHPIHKRQPKAAPHVKRAG